MAAKKFAISVPESVMEQVDRAAAESGVTRSRFIADVLRLTASARSDREITRRINRVFDDPKVIADHRADARAFRRRAPAAGTEW